MFEMGSSGEAHPEGIYRLIREYPVQLIGRDAETCLVSKLHPENIIARINKVLGQHMLTASESSLGLRTAGFWDHKIAQELRFDGHDLISKIQPKLQTTSKCEEG